MMTRISRWGLLVAGAMVFLPAHIGCSRGGTAVPDEKKTEKKAQENVEEKADPTWSRQGDLEIRLEAPAGPHRAGDELAMTLHFRNGGPAPLRIYMLTAEPFRYGQSEFMLKTAAAAKGPPSFQPEPRPHGYKTTAKDFHLLAPSEHRSFTQTLRLYPRQVTQAGPVQVVWTYRNKITRWEGGLQTLDGPTEELFPGGDIPHIWTGKVQSQAEVQVTAD